jgi:hypothetical protein
MAHMLDGVGLSVPDWVPPSVAETASILFDENRDNPEVASVVQRLATDPCMEEVWKTLLSRSSCTKEAVVRTSKWTIDEQDIPTRTIEGDAETVPPYAYVHYAGPRPPPGLKAFADIKQHRAMQSLFIAAVKLRFSAWPIVAKSQLELRQPILDMAARIQENIECFGKLGIGKEAERVVLTGLVLANTKLIAVDRPGDDAAARRQKGYLAALTREVRELFGNSLYGTVATIASVALARNVTEKMVRGVCP